MKPALTDRLRSGAVYFSSSGCKSKKKDATLQKKKLLIKGNTSHINTHVCLCVCVSPFIILISLSFLILAAFQEVLTLH